MVAGVDIGGTSTLVVFVDERGSVIAERGGETPAHVSGEAMVQLAVDLIAELTAETGMTPAAVGIGAAGVVDPVARRIVAASTSFVGWAGYSVGAHLDRALGVPNSLVNDVNAFLLGEVAFGAARGLDNAAGITLGTGVGGAIYLDGALWEGPEGAAGELGHSPSYVVPGHGEEPCTCGQSAHLESIASGRSIERRYRARAGQIAADLPAGDGAALATRARTGDGAAAHVFAEAGLMLGQAAVTLAATLDLGHLVVGGGVSGAWDLIEPGVRTYLAEHPPVSGRTLSVVRAERGSHAVALGAASSARALLTEDALIAS
ncbi:ROK family protein [Mycetocola tolaasinivorans]|uniref:ROK family protein n=1 Tax=Mycetocola tolaasinivorans TaxID=76635 RepID=A0A3L7A891_9MICO|nr:ROK family protein [Mycetocola tolaasinivorans]